MENKTETIEEGELDVWINGLYSHSFQPDWNELLTLEAPPGPHLLSVSSTFDTFNLTILDLCNTPEYFEDTNFAGSSFESQSSQYSVEEGFNSVFVVKFEEDADDAVVVETSDAPKEELEPVFEDSKPISLKSEPVVEDFKPISLNINKKELRSGNRLKVQECPVCKRQFKHNYTLLRHLPIHTDERKFACIECGKAFRQLSTLNQHKVIHSKERPFKCETCEKTFNRVSTLISHRRIHSVIKPYICHICSKGFHQKGNLRNHIHTHTNERPYKCPICAKGFNQLSNLACHKRKAHPSNELLVWKCNKCAEIFANRSQLRNHELHNHKNRSQNQSNR